MLFIMFLVSAAINIHKIIFKRRRQTDAERAKKLAGIDTHADTSAQSTPPAANSLSPTQQAQALSFRGRKAGKAVPDFLAEVTNPLHNESEASLPVHGEVELQPVDGAVAAAAAPGAQEATARLTKLRELMRDDTERNLRRLEYDDDGGQKRPNTKKPKAKTKTTSEAKADDKQRAFDLDDLGIDDLDSDSPARKRDKPKPKTKQTKPAHKPSREPAAAADESTDAEDVADTADVHAGAEDVEENEDDPTTIVDEDASDVRSKPAATKKPKQKPKPKPESASAAQASTQQSQPQVPPQDLNFMRRQMMGFQQRQVADFDEDDLVVRRDGFY